MAAAAAAGSGAPVMGRPTTDPIRPGSHSLGRRRGAGLVAKRAAGGAHTWHHKEGGRAKGCAQHAGFLRAAHQPIRPGGERQARQAQHLIGRACGDTRAGQGVGVNAG